MNSNPLQAVTACAILLGAGSTAAVNGINPPQLTTTVVITATCTPRVAGDSVEIYRARVGPGTEHGALLVQTATATGPVPLAQVERITVDSDSADRNGYAHATLKLKGGSEEQKVMLAVVIEQQIVQLKGYYKTGKTGAVDLLACSKVLFTEPEAAPARALQKAS